MLYIFVLIYNKKFRVSLNIDWERGQFSWNE